MNARPLTNLFKKILFLLYARRPVIMLSEYETPVTDFFCAQQKSVRPWEAENLNIHYSCGVRQKLDVVPFSPFTFNCIVDTESIRLSSGKIVVLKRAKIVQTTYFLLAT